MPGHPVPPESTSPPDRRVELVVAGVVAGLAGLASLALAPLGLVADRLAAVPSPLAAWSGALLSAVLGAGLVWLGIAVAGGSRWAVAVTRSVALVWLVTGTAGALLGVWLVPALAGAGGLAVVAVVVVLVVALLGGGVVAPAALWWLLARPGVDATCRRLRPGPTWVDGCPGPRLTLAVVWGLLAVSAVGMGAYGFLLPVGGIVLAGARGAAAWLAILLGSAALAWATATGARGWWGLGLAATLIATVLTTASFALVDPAAMAAHVPGDTGRALQPIAAATSRLTLSIVNLVAWATLLVVVLRARATAPGDRPANGRV